MRRLIDEYHSIKADENLKERIEKTMSKEMKKSEKKRIAKWTVSVAASFVLAAVVCVNLVPSAAYALGNISAFKNIIKVVTFGRYEVDEGGYHAKINTPKIEGLLDKELEDKLNAEFKENADALISAYENDVKAMKAEFGDETVHMGIESDYVVKTDNYKILALDVYIFNVAGSSSTKHTFYNINKKTGKLLNLKDLFKKDADYVTPISNYIKQQMAVENETNNGYFWLEGDAYMEGFKAIKADQNFYINDNDEIVICFDKYEVAAGAQGCPEFVVPHDVVEDIAVKF